MVGLSSVHGSDQLVASLVDPHVDEAEAPQTTQVNGINGELGDPI